MFDFANILSGFMRSGSRGGSSTSGMGFLTEIFKGFGNPGAQTDEDAESSPSFFKGIMGDGPFGNVGAAINKVVGGFLGPFAYFFNQFTGALQAPETRKEFRAFGMDIDFKEELLSEVPERLRAPFLAVHAQLKADDKKRIDGEIEVLLADKSLSSFEKRARFRALMVSDVANCDGVSPDAAERLETACMEDFGVNKDEDIDALASNLVELSKIRAQGKKRMSPLEKVQQGNYDKTIARFERAINEHEVKVRRIREDIIAKMIAENPGRFDGERRRDVEDYANAWIACARGRGDAPAAPEGCHFNFDSLDGIDRILRGAGKGLGLEYFGQAIERMEDELDAYKAAARGAEFMSPEQQARQGLIHAQIRHARVCRAHKAVAEELVFIEREILDTRARIVAIEGDDAESERYRESYAAKCADLEAKFVRKRRHEEILREHYERLVGDRGVQTELAYQQEKQRFENEEADRVSERRREIEQQGGDLSQVVDLRESIHAGAKRDEAMAVLDGARDLDKSVGSADRISAKDMMLRLGKLEESLSHARRLSTKKEELSVLIRRMEHQRDSTGGMAVDVREELDARIIAAKKELRKEEERLSRFKEETRGASHVFESMREKERVIHEAIASKKANAREVHAKLKEKFAAIKRRMREREEELAVAGFDPDVRCQALHADLERIYKNEGNGVQRGTLIDAQILLRRREEEEKAARVRIERDINERQIQKETLKQEIADLRRVHGAGVDIGDRGVNIARLEAEINVLNTEVQDFVNLTEAARANYKEQVKEYKRLNPIAQAYSARAQVLESRGRENTDIEERIGEIDTQIDALVRDDEEPREQAARLNIVSRILRELAPKLERHNLTIEDLMDKDASLLQAQLKVDGTGGISMDDLLTVPEREVAPQHQHRLR